MDLEQLKIIAELVENTTGDAKDVFVVYFSLYGARIILTFFAVLYGMTFVYKLISKAISTHRYYEKLRELRSIIKPNERGELFNYQIDDIISFVRGKQV